MKLQAIKKLAEIKSGHSFRTAIKDTVFGPILVVQSVNIESRSLVIDSNELKAISKDDCPAGESSYLQPNDVIITARGSARGSFKAAVFQSCDKPVIASSSVYILRLKNTEKILPAYLALYLSSQAGNAELAKVMTGGAIRTVLKKDIADVLVPIPDTATQKILIQLYQNIQAQEAQLSKKIKINNKILQGALQLTLL